MNTVKCKYGPEPAKFFCTCEQPNVYFCKGHLGVHLEEFGDHAFLECSDKLKLTTKFALSAKVSKVKEEAMSMRISMQLNCKNLQMAIEDYRAKVTVKLNAFINICDQVLQEVESIISIPCRLIYSPLQFILCSKNANSIIDTISAPSFKELPSAMNLFSYTTSTFPHMLYNFSDTSLGYVHTSVNSNIGLYPENKTITCQKIIAKSSRFINIGNKRFLFTGGKDPRGQATNECFVLDTDTQQIRAIPAINNPRSSHTMAWIEGNPAIIGGREDSKVLQTVEIFRDNSWLVVDPITVARRSLTSVCSNNGVWILGGHDHNNKLLDTIESNQSGDWRILSLKLPMPSCSIGLCYLENNLLLIGGKTAGKTISDGMYFIDTDRLKIMKLNRLASPIYAPRGQFAVDARRISGLCYNLRRSEISYLNLSTESL